MQKVKQIKVVSNTHWDREFRQSFEKTRHNLLEMLDATINILESDPNYHSFTMDGHTIMIDDYLEMRPERKNQIIRLVKDGRLIIGPYYTLPEEFSVSHEALVRNLMFGKKSIEKYGGKAGTVAYAPASFGKTGQNPQILTSFGYDKTMFYRGVSHHETPAEFIWKAPDGTEMLSSRFALYCRYNWYYQVHRAVSRNRVWGKDYVWGEFDEFPFRKANGCLDGVAYKLKEPMKIYDKSVLKQSILDMLEEEKGHFTTPIFLGMNGHDVSSAFPLESSVIADAKEMFDGEIEIEHTDLEKYWEDIQKYLDREKMTVLTGERRSYLKEGKWTFLFPGTISARTYLKQYDYNAYNSLVYYAEPLSSMSKILLNEYSTAYLSRGWGYLLSNHTHDANGGCAPDEVCKDIEYRYRKVLDIGEIVSEDSMALIAKKLSPQGQPDNAIQVIVYNTLPFERTVIVPLDLEVPNEFGNGVEIEGVQLQAVSSEKSSVFVDSIWDVPTILESVNHKIYARFESIPAFGYKAFEIKGSKNKLLKKPCIANNNTLENSLLKVTVNSNGTVNVLNKETGKEYKELNYFTTQGEVGNAWKHVSPDYDRKLNSLCNIAKMYISENGELTGSIVAQLEFEVPQSCEKTPSDNFATIPICLKYTLDAHCDYLNVKVELNNTAKDYWLRVNFPTQIETEYSIADSHFDIVKRPIEIPDSTGWVEEAFGTHPLRTFAALTDGENGFAVMPKGLFEYEVFGDSTMALTLLRACRIKLAVSEEKMTELEDEGIQCPGKQSFEYAFHFYKSDYNVLANKAIAVNIPVQCAVVGRGMGILPRSQSLLAIDNKILHITAVKESEDGDGIIIRLYNPDDCEQKFSFSFGKACASVSECNMNEEFISNAKISNVVKAKKIMTYKVVFEGGK